MSASTLYPLVGAALVATIVSGLPAAAQQPSPAITIQGEASTKVPPDIATVTLGVVAEQPTAAQAASDAATTIRAVLDQIKADGVAEADIATGTLMLSPVYASSGFSSSAATKPTGFRAATDLVVTVRTIEKAGAIASDAVGKGANTIDGIDYGVVRQTTIIDGLRADAMRDAERKARIYVEALGLHLGRVLEIDPGRQQAMRPMAGMMLHRAQATMGVPAMPVSAGLLRLETSVTVRWEIAP